MPDVGRPLHALTVSCAGTARRLANLSILVAATVRKQHVSWRQVLPALFKDGETAETAELRDLNRCTKSPTHTLSVIIGETCPPVASRLPALAVQRRHAVKLAWFAAHRHAPTVAPHADG